MSNSLKEKKTDANFKKMGNSGDFFSNYFCTSDLLNIENLI